MKRWLFNLAAAFSLLLSLSAVAAWATSHTQSPGWRLIGTAHSPDLTRVNREERTLLFTPTANWSKAPNYGFWDAWWALSQSGQLTLLAQVIDYEGTLGRVQASPPTLTVHLPGDAGAQAEIFAGMSDHLPRPGRFGFAWHSDAQSAHGVGGAVSVRAWMVTLPYWFILLLGSAIPLLWLRASRLARKSRESHPGGSAGA